MNILIINDDITGFENGNQAYEFNLLDELFEIDFVKHTEIISIIQKQHSNPIDVVFHQFSKSVTNDKQLMLMAEFNEGTLWFVVGYVYDGGEILKDLPVWLPKK